MNPRQSTLPNKDLFETRPLSLFSLHTFLIPNRRKLPLLCCSKTMKIFTLCLPALHTVTMTIKNPIFLLSSIVFLATSTMAAAGQQPRPGFLYTRSRGTCTPQYWSSRSEAWPKMVPHASTVSNVFGSRAFERFRADLTLLEAAERNDDGENVYGRLVKESTAALLNSYARKGYPYAAWEVKTLLIQALVSEAAAAAQAHMFFEANQNCG